MNKPMTLKVKIYLEDGFTPVNDVEVQLVPCSTPDNTQTQANATKLALPHNIHSVHVFKKKAHQSKIKAHVANHGFRI